MKITPDILTNTATAQLKNKSAPVNTGNLSDSHSNEKMNKQQAQKFANDIYHKDEHIPLSQNTYDRPLSITAHKSESELLVKMEQTIDFGELTNQFRKIQPKYQDFMKDLQNTAPSLAQKDWGFSIDSNDKLVVSGDITEDEKKYLEDKLNANEDIVNLAKELPDILIKGQEYDRGYDGKGKYWGKYDVTQENFKDIINIKEMLDYSFTTEDHGGLTKNNFDTWKYQDNLRSQLASKAEVKYGY
ncbi:hypothetical protein [Colwellia psychrerythraea]|uniref:Uncharacterized protein n=1 Tax=Colwellia psychrerythraea TaxID=28229 RepID=A0A099KDG7_COLPS|nr:hypothetical protein [Colwellia psychrerythraea]KGJ88416.1 hypothetical protein ND2E_4252 [Colwellia psychrerythraea]